MKTNPQTARKLLHVFASCMIVVACAGSAVYLRVIFNEEVSVRRSAMNEAVLNAQNFFVGRQVLLKSLKLNAVPNVKISELVAGDATHEQLNVNLSDKAGNWSLPLSMRMKDYLYQKKVNLLYVQQAFPHKVMRLYDSSAGSEIPSTAIFQRLNDEASESRSADEDLWITDNNLLDSPFYLFTPLESHISSSGWLCLEVQALDLVDALRSESAGEFMLLDRRGQIIFTNAAKSTLVESLSALDLKHPFGLIGTGWLPDSLAIRKNLGYSGWQIVYAVDIKFLLPVLGWPLLSCLLLCIAIAIALHVLISRIDRRLITPSENRILALVETEAFTRAVLQVAPVALCVIRRADGQLVLENSLSEEWLGNGSELVHSSTGWIYRAFDDVGMRHSDEIQMADGRVLYVAFSPTRYNGQDVLICAFSDITSRKQIEIALDDARKSADQANEAKTLFLATMSHEIRTPLYGVIGTLELLARTELNDQQENYLNAIERSSNNLLQLICDVLDVSRIEAGQLQLVTDTFSLVELVEDLVQGYSGAAEAKGLQFFALIDSTVPEWLSGDVSRIRQILSNLLNNALKFTDYGKITLRIKVDSRDDERVVIHWQVSDTGKGIAHEQQSQLFEPFYQVEVAKNVVAGTGLGLSICKRLMHLMNGTIRLVSEPGLGSSFTLHLPLVQVMNSGRENHFGELYPSVIYVVSPLRELAECYCGWIRRWGARPYLGAPKADTMNYEGVGDGAVVLELHPAPVQHLLETAWAGQSVIAASHISMELSVEKPYWKANVNSLQSVFRALCKAQGKSKDTSPNAACVRSELKRGLRVLVVEDNPINQLILRDQLHEIGCTVELASDGLEALELWQEENFDLVLTDVNMPRMNGYELAVQLRAMNMTQPIIGATANALSDERERCLRAGMNHCLIKPFTLHALSNCLQDIKGVGQ